MTKRMLDRTVKLKNKYKSDLDISQNENKVLKLRLDVMEQRLETYQISQNNLDIMNTISTTDNSKTNSSPRGRCQIKIDSPQNLMTNNEAFPDMFSFDKKSSNDMKFDNFVTYRKS